MWRYMQKTHLTYPTMLHQTNIPQCTILWQKCAHMCTFLLQNGALCDMGLVHYGICETDNLSPCIASNYSNPAATCHTHSMSHELCTPFCLLCIALAMFSVLTVFVWLSPPMLFRNVTRALEQSYICLPPKSLKLLWNRGHSGYGLSQWETTLHCNVVSHWLSQYPEWSLRRLYGKSVSIARSISRSFFSKVLLLLMIWRRLCL